MALIPKSSVKARFINGVCTAIEDLGYFEARYGAVKRVKYTFLSDAFDEDGERSLVHRVFNDDMRRTASQRKAIHRWRGKAIPNDEVRNFNRKTLIGTRCRLKITPTPQHAWREEVEIYGPPTKGRTRKKSTNN